MVNLKQAKCPSCGKKAHDFTKEEALDCVPPKETLVFGPYKIDEEYRKELYDKFPFYSTEEIVGSYLGYNDRFPSQNNWLEQQNEDFDDE